MLDHASNMLNARSSRRMVGVIISQRYPDVEYLAVYGILVY